jgi:cytoskeleton protein RodZ
MELSNSAMGSLSLELKSEREKRRIPLSQIAADTRISLRHLESLEEGRYADLPGGMYNRAFLKAYCETLNLDCHSVIQKYEAELTPPSEKTPKAKVSLPQQKASMLSSPVIAWSMMLLISATGLFFNRKWIATVFSPYFSGTQISARPDTGMKPSPAPTEKPVSQVETLSAATNYVPPNSEAGVVDAGLTLHDESASLPTLRLELEVTEKCWVSVDSDGGHVVKKLLQPGEAQSFDASEQFFVVLGNAGGVRLRINGQPAKPLGKQGEVVKVLINSKNLQDLINQTSG